MKQFSAHEYFEAQYVLRKSLPTFMDRVAEWEALSSEEHFNGIEHHVESYGDHSRQTFELFKTGRGENSRGLAIFIHGGFWRAMDREQSRFVAKPFLENGYNCIIAEYRLMPEFRLSDLVEDTARMLAAIEKLRAEHSLGERTILSGHSAGAHLAVFGLKRLREIGRKLDDCALLLFSGVFDIFPVSRTSIGDELKMSDAEIAKWSVYDGIEPLGTDPLFLVGNDETDDFKRQSILGSQVLSRHGTPNIAFVPDANHLTLMTKFAVEPEFASETLRELGKISG